MLGATLRQQFPRERSVHLVWQLVHVSLPNVASGSAVLFVLSWICYQRDSQTHLESITALVIIVSDPVCVFTVECLSGLTLAEFSPPL